MSKRPQNLPTRDPGRRGRPVRSRGRGRGRGRGGHQLNSPSDDEGPGGTQVRHFTDTESEDNQEQQNTDDEMEVDASDVENVDAEKSDQEMAEQDSDNESTVRENCPFNDNI
jgi:hypothetical protein